MQNKELRLNEDLQKLLLANSEKLENLYQNGAAMKADHLPPRLKFRYLVENRGYKIIHLRHYP